MNLKTVLLAVSALVGCYGLLPSGSAQASPVCPATAYTGTAANNCNMIITFNSDGTITETIEKGATTNYDGNDDMLLGVVNNSGHSISSFSISGKDIFAMDGDGIDTFTHVTNGANGMSQGFSRQSGVDAYGGKDAYFTDVDFVHNNTGVVNFLNGIRSGGTDYFSLESALDCLNPPVVSTPEPATVAVLGAGLLGLAGLRRRKAV